MTPGRIPGLDGLRAVAVLLVLAAHLGLERWVPGGFGVTLFFWISGWLITGQLIAEHRRHGLIDWRGFYLRRALRLLPAACAYVAVAGGAFLAVGGHITPWGWAAALFYGANWYDLVARYQTDVPGVRHPFNILWSLAIEAQFYLVWPVLLSVLWRWRQAWPAVLGLCTAALVWRAWLCHAEAGRSAVWISERLYKGTDTRVDSLDWGALTALLEVRPAWRRAVASRSLQAASLGLLLASLLIPGALFRDVLRYTLQGVALSVLVPALLARDNLARRTLDLLPMMLIGRVSYSVYLWHWLALAAADWLQPADPARWLATALPLSALLAFASYAGIERPTLAWRRHAGSRAPPGLLDRPVQPATAGRRKGFA